MVTRFHFCLEKKEIPHPVLQYSSHDSRHGRKLRSISGDPTQMIGAIKGPNWCDIQERSLHLNARAVRIRGKNGSLTIGYHSQSWPACDHQDVNILHSN